MNELIYLEPDEEITSVIDRLRKANSSTLSLVIPRGASLAQSIVNLKLLKKSANELGKEISLVANDRISRNLASQIGLTVFSKISEAKTAKPTAINQIPKPEIISPEDASFKVNNYYRNKDQEKEYEKPEEEVEVEVEAEESIEEGLSKESVEAEEHQEHSASGKEDGLERYEVKSPLNSKNISKDKDKEYKRSNLGGSKKPLVYVTIISILIVAVLSYFFLPYSTVAIQVKSSDYKLKKEITGDKNSKGIDSDKLVIPSTMISIEKESNKEFDSTGTKDAGEKAKGTVTVYNAFSSQSALILASGTKISSDGKEFLLQNAISVPKAEITAEIVNGVPALSTNPGTVNVDVAASSSGDQYNIAPSKFSVSGYGADKVYAESKSAFSGGVTKTLKLVSDKDLNKAGTDLKEEIAQSVKTELTEKAKKEGLNIQDADIKTEVITESSSKKVDEEGDKFSYTMKVKLYALGFLNKDLEFVIKDYIAKNIESNKMIINPEKAEITYKILSSDIDAGTLTVETEFNGKIGQKMDLEAIKSRIRNKSASQAKDLILVQEGVEKVEVSAWPSFINRTPLLTNRIKVGFVYLEQN